jgi:hypothetical protein
VGEMTVKIVCVHVCCVCVGSRDRCIAVTLVRDGVGPHQLNVLEYFVQRILCCVTAPVLGVEWHWLSRYTCLESNHTFPDVDQVEGAVVDQVIHEVVEPLRAVHLPAPLQHGGDFLEDLLGRFWSIEVEAGPRHRNADSRPCVVKWGWGE